MTIEMTAFLKIPWANLVPDANLNTGALCYVSHAHDVNGIPHKDLTRKDRCARANQSTISHCHHHTCQ